MQVESTTVAPALKALLENLIDYAGCYPPAGLPVDSAVKNYALYKTGAHQWMLRSFVIASGELVKVPTVLDGSIALLGETDNARAASIESKGLVRAERPVYWEVPVNALSGLDVVKASGCFAKIRTGGLKAEAIPSPAEVSAFIVGCAERRLPFKATAGLHHPVRAMYPLTYESQAPQAVMHGFLNVLMAAAFAWFGETCLEPVLSEMDPAAFSFDNCACWKDKVLTAEQVRECRQEFMHSIGSCSFEEPVDELIKLNLMS